MHIVRDAVWGDIRLTDEEYRVANAFEMLRLNRLRQLHLCYLVYPSATHTRYAHSLGTLHAAKRAVIESELPLSYDDKRLLYLAALLHDVGHSAFAHVLEPSIKGMVRHEDMRAAILDGRILENYLDEGVLTQSDVKRIERVKGFVSNVLDGPTIDALKRIFVGDPPWISGLVDNIIDVDTLDYLARDSLFLGLLGRPYDPCIFSAFRLEKRAEGGEGQLAVVFSNDLRVHNAIEDVSFSRWFLFRNAYLHRNVMAANAMLINAFEAGPAEHLRTLTYLVGEDELLSKLARERGECGRVATQLLSRHLYKPAFAINTARVDTLHSAAAENANHGSSESTIQTAKVPVTGESSGLPRPTDLAREVAEKPSARGRFLREAKKATGFEPLVGYPLVPPSKDYPGLLVEGGLTFGEISPSDVTVYRQRYPLLSTMYVYSSEPDPISIEALTRFCAGYFGSPSEYTPPSALESSALDAALSGVVEDLARNFPGATKVLRHLTRSGPVTLAKLMSMTGKTKATVDAHLRSIDHAMRQIPTPVLISRMNGRVKEWYVQRPELRDAIRTALDSRSASGPRGG